MGHTMKSLLGIAAVSAVALSVATAAEARCRGHHCRTHDEPGYRYIYVESNYGSRRAVAPVRQGPMGEQVRLPGGAWIDCEITCEYTLRRTTVDFWEDQQNRSTSPNYLRYDIDLDNGHVRRHYP
jgi:hypothetical protein